MPRCCEPIPDEFKPSYASVLSFGRDPDALRAAVDTLETKHCLTSCFTAWCPRCKRNYLLTRELPGFPAPSAHHTHQLALLQILRESGVVFAAD
jgi:hypothetical protein